MPLLDGKLSCPSMLNSLVSARTRKAFSVRPHAKQSASDFKSTSPRGPCTEERSPSSTRCRDAGLAAAEL
eukprot:11645258-Karenia_brevis.AAC.1